MWSLEKAYLLDGGIIKVDPPPEAAVVEEGGVVFAVVTDHAHQTQRFRLTSIRRAVKHLRPTNKID